MTNRDDLYYIDLVKHGDTAAYSYLVERYKDMVYSIAVKMLHNETEAEDLSQEVFIVVYKTLTKFKGDSKFSTWLYRVTYNKAISKLRKSNRVTITENDTFLENHLDTDELKIELTDKEENIEELQKALKKLSKEEQLLIMLHYFENQSIEEIAQVTMFSESNVKVKLFRVRKKLKDWVEASRLNIPVIH